MLCGTNHLWTYQISPTSEPKWLYFSWVLDIRSRDLIGSLGCRSLSCQNEIGKASETVLGKDEIACDKAMRLYWLR